jgi:hypothetical protein
MKKYDVSKFDPAAAEKKAKETEAAQAKVKKAERAKAEAKAAAGLPTYRVEILVADRTGLTAFIERVAAAQKGKPNRGAMVKSSDSGLGAYPMVSDGEHADLARVIGPLNRTIIPARVNEYRNAMWRGEWWFTPDPIVVTDEGHIINGQHRLLASVEALPDDAGEVKPPPQFVVVWGVDKRAAILMDEARRTATDRRDIALRFASAQTKPGKSAA